MRADTPPPAAGILHFLFGALRTLRVAGCGLRSTGERLSSSALRSVLGIAEDGARPAATASADDGGFDLGAALAAASGGAGAGTASSAAPVEINWDVDAADVAAEAERQARSPSSFSPPTFLAPGPPSPGCRS